MTTKARIVAPVSAKLSQRLSSPVRPVIDDFSRRRIAHTLSQDHVAEIVPVYGQGRKLRGSKSLSLGLVPVNLDAPAFSSEGTSYPPMITYRDSNRARYTYITNPYETYEPHEAISSLNDSHKTLSQLCNYAYRKGDAPVVYEEVTIGRASYEIASDDSELDYDPANRYIAIVTPDFDRSQWEAYADGQEVNVVGFMSGNVTDLFEKLCELLRKQIITGVAVDRYDNCGFTREQLSILHDFGCAERPILSRNDYGSYYKHMIFGSTDYQ